MVPVMPGNQFYMTAPNGAGTGPTGIFMPVRITGAGSESLSAAPNTTLIYNRPQYRMNAAIDHGRTIRVKVIVLPDTSLPGSDFRFPGQRCTRQQRIHKPLPQSGRNLPPWMNYTSTATGTSQDRNILVINVGAMVTAFGNPAVLATSALFALCRLQPPTNLRSCIPQRRLTRRCHHRYQRSKRVF